MQEFGDKTAVITGAGSGSGLGRHRQPRVEEHNPAQLPIQPG